MNSFPRLPGYAFSWRSIQVEPIPNSGERITLGVIVKGKDKALMVAKTASSKKLSLLLGDFFAEKISDVFRLSLEATESFYSENSIFTNWNPPIDGVFISSSRSSLAENIEDALIKAGRASSSLFLASDTHFSSTEIKQVTFNAQTWRKEILTRVKAIKQGMDVFFDQDIQLSGSGIPFKFGFVSTKYAAHFDAISPNRANRSEALMRAQSKLWQLDQLRDSDQLFHQEIYELVLHKPRSDDSYIEDFIEELKDEAQRREIGLYPSQSAIEAAEHVIERAA